MKEFDIRPPKIFDEFLRLAKKDIITFFSNSDLESINCPACNSIGNYSFKKDGFNYCECPECLTLYVNPRPIKESFANYYTNSPSSKFWATTFYKKTEKARREKIWKPKAQMILNELEKQKAMDYQIVDIGGGYGIFAEEIQKLNNQKVILIEPSPHFSKICREKGLEVVEEFLEDVTENDLPSGKKCFVSFELFEHLHSPKIFLNQLNKLMQPNDLFIFTTLSGTGLDIQVLWQESPSVSPPHHLNFFNPVSVKLLLENEGYNCLSVSTPGKLDVDILFNNKKNIKSKFWKTFIKHSDKNQKEMCQNFITSSGWSSHMMVVSRKNEI
jgi:SAM-dependent methyltransferase